MIHSLKQKQLTGAGTMKKLLAAALVGALTVVSVQAQAERTKPNCASIDEILDVLKQRGVTNIVELKSEDGMWIAETIDANGKRNKEVVVYCSNAELGTLATKEVKLNTPPKDAMPIKDILASVRKDFGGQISSATFKSGRWVIEVTLPYRGSDRKLTTHKLYYGAYGKLMINTITD